MQEVPDGQEGRLTPEAEEGLTPEATEGQQMAEYFKGVNQAGIEAAVVPYFSFPNSTMSNDDAAKTVVNATPSSSDREDSGKLSSSAGGK